MKYFKVFLNKGNAEVHGQIVYKNSFILPETLCILFLNHYTEKLEGYRLHSLYLDFEHLKKVGKTLDYKYLYKKPN